LPHFVAAAAFLIGLTAGALPGFAGRPVS